jgi:hypothetical protein
MIEQLKLYLFILSIIFVLRYLIELIFKFLIIEEPTPIVVTNTGEVFLYLSISYIITFLIL